MIPDTASLATIEAAIRYQSRNKMAQYFPDTGPLRRDLYVKHMLVFEAGSYARERAVVAANRAGKTELGSYELACHLTGKYPHWWRGHRFTRPINAWAAGNSNLTTRDILQAKILGKMKRDGADKMDEALGLGTGMVPADFIKTVRPKSGIPDAIETAYIRHASGGLSVLTFKSYEQGRESFEGTEQDFVMFDEEPPLDVYTEAVMRTMATGSFKGGLILLTFTPLKGWTDVISKFFDEDERKATGRFLVQIEWDEVPHLSESEKKALLATIPEFQRDARSKGIPQLGSGAIYPIAESSLVIDPFEIPAHWPRCYGLDVGWNTTAAIWLAKDRESDTVYAYSELVAKQQQEHSATVKAIKARGEWIPGVIDPASRGRSQKDGSQLIQVYRDLGLNIVEADNAVEAGIHAVQSLMESGRLKIFKSLVGFLAEFRKYRRDDKGRIVKKDDHLMDAARYAVKSGLDRARTKLAAREPSTVMVQTDRFGSHDIGGRWMS